MKRILLILAFIALASAFSVKPDYQGVQDTGSGGLINAGITIDCATNALSVSANANDTGSALANANVYLFYTNYGYQVIATGKTGTDGVSAINVAGTRNYLTSLFVLRVEAQGYQSEEIEFTYKKCFDAPPKNETKPPVINSTINSTTNTSTNTTVTPPPNVTENKSNVTQPPPVANVTQQPENKTQNNPPPAKPSSCLPAFLLISVLALCLKR